MGEARDTTTVFTKTSEPYCSGCINGNGEIKVSGGDFQNSDCVANRAARMEKGLSTEACGLILMQYSVDRNIEWVFKNDSISPQSTHRLRKISIEPIGGRFELLGHYYETRGHPRLVVDLEDD